MAHPAVSLAPVDDPAAYAEPLLADAGLPTDDLGNERVRLYVARAGDEPATDGERVGVGGLEIHGRDALLRSVAVEPDRRGEGFGTALVAGLETEARVAGVDRLTLLTTTASGFFAARGYAEIARGEVPEPIRATAEFSDLCPASATVMRKPL